MLNAAEQEIIFLNAINTIIDSIVNLEMLSLRGADPDSNILFATSTHQRFFYVLLVDLLSRTDKRKTAIVEPKSYLEALRHICDQPNFDVNNSIAALRDAVSEFRGWLDTEVVVERVYLPSIDFNGSIHISRLAFIKLCGDVSKHNILRLVGAAEELQAVLAHNGAVVSVDDAMLAMDDFYRKFHDDILNYHGSTIVEFLNNIRWGIHDYLQPEFRRSIVWEGGDPPMYRFTYPSTTAHNYARACYWDLMNQTRGPPYLRRFRVTRWLKLRY